MGTALLPAAMVLRQASQEGAEKLTASLAKSGAPLAALKLLERRPRVGARAAYGALALLRVLVGERRVFGAEAYKGHVKRVAAAALGLLTCGREGGGTASLLDSVVAADGALAVRDMLLYEDDGFPGAAGGRC